MKRLRRRYPLLLAVAVVVLATPLFVAATASKGKARRVTAVTCGQTVTTSVVLANDLSCPGNGLVVGANGITINLNGHTISGNGGNGIIDSQHTSVTITNGTITGFTYGVILTTGANNSRVQGLRLIGNTNDGVIVQSSSGDVLSGNYALSNGGNGISLAASSIGTQVIGNWVENNTNDGIGAPSGDAGYVISQNRALNNGHDGIELQAFNAVQVNGNIANGNAADGISTAAVGPVTLTGNRASFNGALGILAAPGQKDGGGNVVQDNTTAAQCKNVVCAEVNS